MITLNHLTNILFGPIYLFYRFMIKEVLYYVQTFF